MRNAAVARVLATEAGRFTAIESFGELSTAISPALLPGGNTELLAQAQHAKYVRNEEGRATLEDNPAMASWQELHGAWKEANRRFADGIGRTLQTAGCVLVPLALRDSDTPVFEFTAEEVESLARG